MLSSSSLPASSTEKNPDVTLEELERFGNAFKNDEFRKLFADYVNEISDPKNREIYEREIAELERERGNNVKFMTPTPGHVIKTKFIKRPEEYQDETTVEKCFVNICTHEEIKEANATTSGKGTSWNVPYSLAKPRLDLDHANARCLVFDFIVNPQTYKLSQSNIRIHDMIVGIALEAIEKQHNAKLDKKYKTPKLKYKGTPASTAIREKDPNVTPKAETTEDFIKKMKKVSLNNNSQNTAPLQKETEHRQLIQELDECTTQKKQPVGEVEPKYAVIHQDAVDYSKYTSNRDKPELGGRPDFLLVRIETPLCPTASVIDLDTTSTTVSMHVPGKYKLSLTLPFEVSEEEGQAKFDKTKRILSLRLPVKKVAEVKKDEPALIEEVVDEGKETETEPQSNESQSTSALVVELPEPTAVPELQEPTEEEVFLRDPLPTNSQICQYTIAQDEEAFTIVIDTKGIMKETLRHGIDVGQFKVVFEATETEDKLSEIFTRHLWVRTNIDEKQSRVINNLGGKLVVILKKTTRGLVDSVEMFDGEWKEVVLRPKKEEAVKASTFVESTKQVEQEKKDDDGRNGDELVEKKEVEQVFSEKKETPVGPVHIESDLLFDIQ